VAALHERLILLSPSLCARELFSCRKTEKVKKTLQRWGGRSPDKGSFSENISLAFPERKRERMASEGEKEIGGPAGVRSQRALGKKKPG